MAFQTTGSNNRVIHKSSPKKQLTYRAPPKTDSDNREYYGDNTYNRNDLNSSEDRRDHQGSSYITDPHGYNTSQEVQFCWLLFPPLSSMAHFVVMFISLICCVYFYFLIICMHGIIVIYWYQNTFVLIWNFLDKKRYGNDMQERPQPTSSQLPCTNCILMFKFFMFTRTLTCFMKRVILAFWKILTVDVFIRSTRVQNRVYSLNQGCLGVKTRISHMIR